MNDLFSPTARAATTVTSIIALSRPIFALALASLILLALAYQFAAPMTIDVGSGNDTALIQGFSFRENFANGDPSTSLRTGFRWSGARSEIRFWGIGDQDGTLKLRLAAPRPNGSARVQVFANGKLTAEVQPSADFQEFVFPIDRATIGAGGDLIVTLASDTFSQAPDPRELGVQVDRARFEARGAPILPSPRALYLVALALLAFFIARAWSGNLSIGIFVSALAILVGAIGLFLARVETIWFAAPLFWFGLLIFFGARIFARALQRLDAAQGTFALTSRTVRILFGVMALAFAVRMIFATGPGFIVDVQDYVVWSYKTVTYGLGSAYRALDGLWISDQSPGLVYIIHLMGLVYRAVFSPDFLYPNIAGDPNVRALATNPAVLADPVQRTLLRVPSLIADLLTGALIFVAARKNGAERRSARASWLVALGYWFNPAVLWNGAYWGQTDAIHSLLVLAAFLLMNVKQIGWAFFVLGIAALTKPQAAIFAPLLLLCAWRNPSSPPLSKGGKWAGVIRALAAGALGAGLMLAPMILAGGTEGMLAYFADTVGHHPILSANAHNLWWLLTNGRINVPDTSGVVAGAPLTLRAASLLLFGAFYLAILIKAWRGKAGEMFALGALIAFAFFMLPTEIHENYGYALLPLLAVALTRDKKLIPFYIGVSATMVLNYALSDPPLFARLGIDDPDTQLALARQLNAALNTILLIAWTIYIFARRGIIFQTEKSLEPQGVTR